VQVQSLQTQPFCALQEALFQRITHRIRQSLELETILTATVAEVQAFLGSDRVKIYQFLPDGSGVVIAEAIGTDTDGAQRLPSLLGLHFPADDIPLYARELFVQARQRSIVDLTTQQIGVSPLDCPETGTPLEPEDIRYRPVDPCHAEYLRAMGVSSSVVVPIVLENQAAKPSPLPSLRQSSQLWGLLAFHHSQPCQVSEENLQFIQSVVDQVSIAIAQSTLLEQMRQQAEQEANINRITALLHTAPTVQIQAALEETVRVFDGIGGRLYLTAEASQNAQLYAGSQLYTCGEQPERLDQGRGRPIEENLLWQKFLYSGITPAAPAAPPASTAPEAANPWSVQWMQAVYALTPLQDAQKQPAFWAIGDLYREPLFRSLAPSFQSSQIRSLLILPLSCGQEIVGCLTIFRKAVNTEILWAGYHTPDSRQLMPRQSFETWQELREQVPNWTEADLKLAQALDDRFATAVKQFRLEQQVQALNQHLEQQVRDRTTELQAANAKLQQFTTSLQAQVEQQKLSAWIIASVRQSIQLEETLQVAVAEVQQILQADRVVVFRFHPNLADGSEVIAEAALPGVLQIAQSQIADRCVNSAHLEKYRSGYVHAIEDLFNAGLQPCYINMMATLQVRSVLAIPLATGDQLWGFLCVHYCTEPHQWQVSEIEFVEQIAAQLGIAAQHSLLLSQVNQQADQLGSTLDDLKRTQTQLLQTEKTSGIGQLVAGVAHEINNPIGFIYSNLDSITGYMQTLLDLLQLYRQEQPQVSAELQQKLDQADLDFIAGDLPNLRSSLQTGTNRIREIALSLRNFSRLEQSGVKPVDIHEGIAQALLVLQHRLKSPATHGKIEVVCSYGELPLVDCFPGQINQVFTNLLSNAVDSLHSYKPDPSTGVSPTKTITIATRFLEPDWVRISIKDNGEGILTKLQKRLFDPFFTTKSSSTGTGLGLSVSYQIIEQHQGKLFCVSKPGEGAEFIVELPVHYAGSSAAAIDPLVESEAAIDPSEI
jgi:light-regulated signal transduction histidine kinase (bacteriophytochrome)